MKIAKRYITTLLWALLAGAVVASAEEPVRVVDARFEPDSVLLGDHFNLVMDLEVEGGRLVAFPTITPEFAEGRIELLEERRVDTLNVSEGRYRLRKSYRMISFEPAQYRIDSVGVLVSDGRVVDTLYAPEALELEVAMIPVDTAQKTIYDIKQPLPMPVTAAEVVEIAGYSFAVLAVVVALVALVIYLVRRSRKEEVARRKIEPAHVVAIRSLEALANQKLWQNGRVKEYYSRLTEIFRTYLAGRFGVGALEMTTEEIVAAMKSLTLTPKQMADLVALLTESDLVKFAKFIPEAESNEAAYYTIYYFVEESKEVAEEVVSPEEQEIEVVTPKEEEKSDE